MAGMPKRTFGEKLAATGQILGEMAMRPYNGFWGLMGSDFARGGKPTVENAGQALDAISPAMMGGVAGRVQLPKDAPISLAKPPRKMSAAPDAPYPDFEPYQLTLPFPNSDLPGVLHPNMERLKLAPRPESKLLDAFDFVDSLPGRVLDRLGANDTPAMRAAASGVVGGTSMVLNELNNATQAGAESDKPKGDLMVPMPPAPRPMLRGMPPTAAKSMVTFGIPPLTRQRNY